jgi:molybdopterin-containing oxidoreductase family iron-sulfur binding subunit
MNRDRDPGLPWRSLDELADAPEFRRFVEDEFPGWADSVPAPDRRGFLKLMGASLALAGMTSCRWPAEEIFPFADRPDGYVPGDVRSYATAGWIGGVALGLLVTSRDGRPTKIEGNPLHPSSLQGTTAMAQASLLDLYDPSRSRAADGAWESLDRTLAGRLAGARASGRGARVLSEPVRSPTLARLRQRFLERHPEARWHEWSPLSREEERSGTALAFGAPHRPVYRLERARVILSLGDDFLMDHPAAVRWARDFVDGRSAPATMSRLYVVESAYSVTGTMADHRIPLAERMIPVWAGCLGANLLLEHGLELPAESGELGRMLERFQAHPLYTQLPGAIGHDLTAGRGESLLVAGPRQPAAVHALAHTLNHALGNVGHTVAYLPDPDPGAGVVESIVELARAMSAGEVDTLLVLGGNPAFDAPADLDVARLLSRVDSTVHVGLYANETARACDVHLPEAHWLETWGDVRDWFGTYSVAQPLIEPLTGGRSAIEVVAMLAGEPASGHDLVRATFGGAFGPGEDGWRRALHDGLVPDSGAAAATPLLGGGWVDRLAPFLRTHVVPGATTDVELTFLPDPTIRDGSFANNAWLQELPEPLTKLTWDNALLLGPTTARALGVWQEDVVAVASGGREVTLPVYVMPGQAEGTAAVFLGHGRREGAPVAEGAGVDVYPLRTLGSPHWTMATVTRTGRRYPLASTQDHYAIDPLGARESAERSAVLAQEIDLHDWRRRLDQAHHADPHAADSHADGADAHAVHEAPLWEQWEYEGYKWGMSIDLNACIGCNACVVACQAENNVPSVGKDEVARGREMLWLRVDRYFHGEIDAPAVSHQPMPCQHCENAPCEQVCPVAATVHDSDGLNLMVYNRCVGTRYCSNNCPYKVRRFNYFNNHKNETPLERMKYNPDVTVRGRGVMEKCTFCVQRIQAAKIRAHNEGRRVADGEVTTACAQACPTRAIVFGDLNDPKARVHELHDDGRAYSLLEWLAVKPRVRYLARLRNRASGAGGEAAPAVHGS